MMKRLLLSACLLCTVLSACSGLRYQRGVGFSGIDGEPDQPPQDSVAGAVVSRAAGPIEALAAHAPVRLQVAAADPAQLAGAAIAHGGRNPAGAVTVSLGGAPLMLSLVVVNGVSHAVLRLPEGQRGRLGEGAGPAFAAAVPRLTGCLAAGPAVRRDRPAKAAGLAVPLNCR